MPDGADRIGEELVEFFTAGTKGAGAYRCADCGYGISIRAALPVCPMCSGEIWEASGRAARTGREGHVASSSGAAPDAPRAGRRRSERR